LNEDYESGNGGRTGSRRTSGYVSESDELNEKVRCDYCGNQLRRLAREGFLQKKVYSKFGYFPWECPLCREPVLVKQQHRLKKRSGAETGTNEQGRREPV
jgi:DNA-directed RNA polymerase subunit RPC12/RpoP